MLAAVRRTVAVSSELARRLPLEMETRLGKRGEELFSVAKCRVAVDDKIEILGHSWLAVRHRGDPARQVEADAEAMQHLDQSRQCRWKDLNRIHVRGSLRSRT